MLQKTLLVVGLVNMNLIFIFNEQVKESKDLIGPISLLNIDESLKSGKLAYCLSKRYWNRGLMTEAVKFVLSI